MDHTIEIVRDLYCHSAGSNIIRQWGYQTDLTNIHPSYYDCVFSCIKELFEYSSGLVGADVASLVPKYPDTLIQTPNSLSLDCRFIMSTIRCSKYYPELSILDGGFIKVNNNSLALMNNINYHCRINNISHMNSMQGQLASYLQYRTDFGHNDTNWCLAVIGEIQEDLSSYLRSFEIVLKTSYDSTTLHLVEGSLEQLQHLLFLVPDTIVTYLIPCYPAAGSEMIISKPNAR